MLSRQLLGRIVAALTHHRGLTALCLSLATVPAGAQSFRVQCPSSTTLHSSDTSAAYLGPLVKQGTITRADGTQTTLDYVDNGGGIKCQQISGGDGFATMGDGTQTYLFGFGPLSGLADQVNGLPGTEPASAFNKSNVGSSGVISDIFVGAPTPTGYTFNGAVGLSPDPEVGGIAGGHIDPRLVMDVGVMNANMPAPLMAIDEDDEFFLTLTNVGMVMRPDLFEQHTVHFHGYPNASSYYDGVPDASIAINIGGSFSYYYLAPDAGTYFWHCHISPPEHLQMGMVGQLYVRPRQNRVPVGTTLYSSLKLQQGDLRTKCGNDVLCSSPLPANGGDPANNTGDPTKALSPVKQLPDTRAYDVALKVTPTQMYAYNDGDGSTAYDVEYPIQIHGFDPNFHFVGMTFNPESFTDLKDKYFLLNGRSYPDTVQPGSMTTQSTDGTAHTSQPVPTIINIPLGGKALLRIADLDVTEYQTLASLGIPMHVVGLNARLLRDLAGNDMSYNTNSITLGGGESIDVILDASDATLFKAGQKFYLYTPNLDHLSNDAENFGGLMTEVNICPGAIDPKTKACIPTT
jgi:FtsP/CotA-like multicopper oxidase with cupredoxin domain